MKIVHIITDLNNGGAEATLCRLTAANTHSGNVQSVVCLMNRGVYADRLEKSGIAVTCLNMPRGRLTLQGLLALYRHIKTNQPDIVQTWMYHADLVGGIVARLAGVKSIVWGIRHSNLDPETNNKLSLLIAKICGRLSSLIPAKIACCSAAAAPLHEAIGYRSDKIRIIPNGYPLDLIKRCTELRKKVRDELGLDMQTPVIGMVARYHPQKDHGNLIDAMKRLKENHQQEFTCILVGDGMTRGNIELRQRIEQAGLGKKIILLGPRIDIVAIMNALDIHVLSSLGEAFPNVVAEAMACGTPCVTTDVGDAALIVGDTGWIAPPRNDNALANAIAAALTCRTEQPESWALRQNACRTRIIEKFSMASMLAAYQQLWSEVVAVPVAAPAQSEQNNNQPRY